MKIDHKLLRHEFLKQITCSDFIDCNKIFTNEWVWDKYCANHALVKDTKFALSFRITPIYPNLSGDGNLKFAIFTSIYNLENAKLIKSYIYEIPEVYYED